MKNILILSGLLAGVLSAQELSLISVTPFVRKEAAPNLKLWRSSVTALAVANALDIHSSWGKYEMNKTLAESNGRFGRESALIKLALQGGLLGFEYLITRGHPNRRLYMLLSVVNFGAAGAIGGVAGHNYTVSRPR